MKKCHKCGRTYDNSWEVCLQCRKPLIDIKSGGKMKQEKGIGYGKHFSNFLTISFMGLIFVTLLLWFISTIMPLIIPFAILLTIFTVFIYPSIKIKEKITKKK